MARHTKELQDETPGRHRRKAVTVAEVVEFLEYLAPPALAAPQSPYSGLQIGAASARVKSVVVTPCATYSAISYAAARKSALTICAAPLITSAHRTFRWDDPIGARVAHLVQRQVSLYVLSSSYITAPGGFDDSLAERLGLAASGSLVPTSAEQQLKLVVFVPHANAARVRDAAAEAGAGVIGAYTHCAFQSRGVGTFTPRNGASPAIGSVGKLEEVEESRLEMVVPEREIQGVIAAVLEAHPYEEVAYDLYPLRNPGVLFGRGRVGELPLKVSLETILAQVTDALELGPQSAARCSHRPGLPIGTLAVASGSCAGESLLWAAHRRQAGAIVMGGADPQDLMLADGTATVLIDAGFAPTVAPGLQRLVAQLRDTFGRDGIEVDYAP